MYLLKWTESKLGIWLLCYTRCADSVIKRHNEINTNCNFPLHYVYHNHSTYRTQFDPLGVCVCVGNELHTNSFLEANMLSHSITKSPERTVISLDIFLLSSKIWQKHLVLCSIQCRQAILTNARVHSASVSGRENSKANLYLCVFTARLLWEAVCHVHYRLRCVLQLSASGHHDHWILQVRLALLWVTTPGEHPGNQQNKDRQELFPAEYLQRLLTYTS